MAMKPGNVSQTAWRRSVGKQFHMRHPETVSSLSRESRYAVIENTGDTCTVCAGASAYGSGGMTAYYAVLEAAGNVASGGALPTEVSLGILLPAESDEEILRQTAEGAEAACRKMNLQAACVRAEVSPSVSDIIVTAEAAGTAEKTACAGLKGMRPGQEILLCGYVALEGTLRIVEEAEEELKKRFVPSFLDGTKGLAEELVTADMIRKACGLKMTENGGVRPCVTAVRQIGSVGILVALWDMAEMSGTGLEADMHRMTLRQETVEICEYFQLNPYQMTSSGSFLLAADHAEEVIEVLEKAGARAGRLGVARAGRAKVITSGEEVRYLDRPAPDELMRWWGTRPVSE